MMKIFTKTRKYLRSIAKDGFFGSFAKRNPEAKVCIGIDHASGPDQTVYSVPLPEWNKLVDEKMALKKKLEDATEAFRKIECLTNDKTDIYVMDQIHTISQNAHRATL